MKIWMVLGALMLANASVILALDVQAPEIDAQSGAAALALLSGGLMILRSRKK